MVTRLVNRKDWADNAVECNLVVCRRERGLVIPPRVLRLRLALEQSVWSDLQEVMKQPGQFCLGA